MANPVSVGIQSIGTFLPPEVRTNDYWSSEIVEGWRRKRQESLTRPKLESDDVMSEGARKTFASMASFGDDLFRGAVRRHVMPKTMMPSDMEFAAAQDALNRAGVAAADIDLFMIHSAVPDQLSVPNAPKLHQKLGLPRRCHSLGVETVCNSFMTQYSLAEQMVRAGLASRALLVQSSALGQLMTPDDQQSVWFGDGATAVVLGPVPTGRGTLGQAHFTDGAYHKALGTCGIGSERWWEADKQTWHVRDPKQARDMLMRIADVAKESIEAALDHARVTADQVGYYATHQSTAWFRSVTAEHAGLSHARAVDTFAWTASLGACNVPFMLACGEREGLLRDGDLVAMHSGGSGIMYSAIISRWGH